MGLQLMKIFTQFIKRVIELFTGPEQPATASKKPAIKPAIIKTKTKTKTEKYTDTTVQKIKAAEDEAEKRIEVKNG
jgi:hypothetical protein